MQIEATIYCDGPGCERSVHIGPDRFTGTGRIKSLPPGYLTVNHFTAVSFERWNFCGPDCLLKWAAEFPAEEVIPWNPES